MSASAPQLPNRFPVGTKCVIEGRRDRAGNLRILSRYVEFPDGRHVDLPAESKPGTQSPVARIASRPRQRRKFNLGRRK